MKAFIRLKPLASLVCAAVILLTSHYVAAEPSPSAAVPATHTKTIINTQTAANPNQTMAELLKQIKAGRVSENKLHKQREADFSDRKDQQQNLLEQAKQQLTAATQLSQELERQFHHNEINLAQQQQRLQERLGDFGELFGVVRQIAADTGVQLEQSMISSQLPNRSQTLNQIAKQRDLPTTADIKQLWFSLAEEMREQGRVVQFDAPVLDSQGIESTLPVTRIGPFVSFTPEGKFLRYFSATGQLNELPRQPRIFYQNAANNLSNADAGSVIPAPVDPSSGAILSLLIQRPDMAERIQQGGIIGYIVIFIGLIGLLLGLERIISLSIVSSRIKQQIQHPDVIGNNALGRIFQAFANSPQAPTDSAGIERLELKLDDLILKETPTIRRGLSTLKVLAGIAPLLGLLGTVTGMVETFDVITLFGSGDAKLMAGGISQALVTTALGLTVAIPILLLHSVANSHSRRIVESLEEQSAGLLAQYSERTSRND